MEEFKQFDEILLMDQKHRLLADFCGRELDLKLLHQVISEIELIETVPPEIVGQFNVAKNMALYCYFFYALAPEVQLKTYTVIELALRIKVNSEKPLMLRQLLNLAVKNGWITDTGFRHIKNPELSNPYSKNLLVTLPALRNMSAHGSTALTPDFYFYLTNCADLVNQIFSKKHE
jgi:hypothetical protein